MGDASALIRLLDVPGSSCRRQKAVAIKNFFTSSRDTSDCSLSLPGNYFELVGPADRWALDNSGSVKV